jgi:hypothetical protein
VVISYSFYNNLAECDANESVTTTASGLNFDRVSINVLPRKGRERQ